MQQTNAAATCTTDSIIKACIAVGFSFLLLGCQRAKDVDYLWQDYGQRLSNVIEHPYTAADFVPQQISRPKPVTRPSQTISILETLSLSHCQLGTLIADHNSTLGKVAPPSQQFIYQIRFIQLAPACIATLEAGPLRRELTQALKQKQDGAMEDFNRVLTRDRSITQSLFIGYDSLVLDKTHAGRFELESALGQLLDIKRAIAQQAWQQIDTKQIEPTLALLAHQSLLPKYLRSLSYSQAQLVALNDYLTEHAASITCRPGHANHKQEILQNVFHKFYLAQIQAYLSQLNQLHYRLNEPLLALFEGSSYQGFIELHFGEQQDALPAKLKTQMRRHVKWWQAFRESCNIPLPNR